MTHVNFTAARNDLTDLFNRVVFQGERVVISRRGKESVAMISMSDLDKLRAAEDEADIRAADAALAESSARILYDDVRKELGL